MADDMDDTMYEDDEFDFFYVEDTYPLADELAETSVPEPGYAGTAWELGQDYFDYDLFEYWDDLEYGDDIYWDSGGSAETGQKRKRGEGRQKTAIPDKRRKLSLKETSGGTSIYMSMAERNQLWNRRAPVNKGLKRFALLPDWRERCAKADKMMSVKAMPEEMKKAAEGAEEDTPEKERHYDAEVAQDEEAGWEDEDEDEDGAGEAGDLQAELANLDPEILESILRQKLGDAGLEGMDEGAFMQTIGRMLSGDDGADDAAGELANSLLGQATEGNDSALTGWLSQQGVTLDKAEDEDDADSVATAELPEGSQTGDKGKGTQVSPSDSGIEIVKNGRTSQMAMHDGSPKLAKKRVAPITDEEDGVVRKRKKVTFDVPASQESEAAAGADGASNGDTPACAPVVSEEQHIEMNDPAPAEPTITAKQTRASKSTTTTTSASTPSTAKPRAAKPKPEPTTEPAGPAKSTRKRKARADEEDEPAPQPPPKKRTGKAAAASSAKDQAAAGGEDGEDKQPSYARPTRATRARKGK